MTSTMEHGEVIGLSDEVIAKMRERFAAECKRLLEGLAANAKCTCGAAEQGAAAEHRLDCPIGIWREAAHAVWFWGQRP